METLITERSIWLDAPRERVWEALTNPQAIVQWLVPNLPGAEMSSDEDGKLSMHMGPMAVDFMLLEEREQPNRATWRGLPDRQIGISFALEEQRGGTLLTLAMRGLEQQPAAAREERLAQSGAGWERALKNLQAYLNGAELPFPQAYVAPLLGYWRESKKTVAIERSIWIAASRERVWRAITDPGQVQQWFSPGTTWELTAFEPGGRLFVRNEETGDEMYTQVIDLIDPPRQLVTHSLPEQTEVSYVTSYTLEEEREGTRLTLNYSGFELTADEAIWGAMEQHTFGFGMMLQNIKAFIEGQSLPVPGGF